MQTEPTKEELIKLYTVDHKSLDEISSMYGYKSRVVVTRLLKTYDIPIRTKAESTMLKYQMLDNEIKVDKITLEEDLKTHSILQLSKKYGIYRGRISKWITEYGLDVGYFKHTYLHDELIKVENVDLSPKQLAIKYSVDVKTIKSYKKDFTEKLYSIDDIKDKILEYNYDLNNQGLVKQIMYDDTSLYISIIKHTDSHIRFGNKFTERLYRILNDIEPNKEHICSNCKKVDLKFYTMELGYGCSEYKLCGSCNNVLNGVSKLSQKLFTSIYHLLLDNEDCHFHDLNSEKVLYMEDDFILSNPNANKRYYKPDFMYKDKIIEFDGSFYHNDEDKEITKDKFYNSLNYKVLHIPDKEYVNYPQETIQKCINFLTV